ncbi:MAG TPA: hypothetical protein VJU60_04110 [Thermoleophilaceae bacterium]|nr:hypothetical protein [Thermoleophilaceae bacterium]
MGRRLDIPPLLAAAGGLLLLVSLFLHWYAPALTAWRVFEVWDLVLAAVALWAMWVVLAPLVWDGPRREGALPLAGIAALVIVASQLINHPPLAHHHPARAGAWLALIGAALIAGGGVLSAGRVSLSISFAAPAPERERERSAAEPAFEPPRAGPSPATEARAAEPEVQEELYPDAERRGPIGADDPEPWTAGPEDETLPFEPDTEEQERT